MKVGTRSDAKLSLHDYSQALGEAVVWLGERYVLASPQKPYRRHHTPPDFLRMSNQWNLPHVNTQMSSSSIHPAYLWTQRRDDEHSRSFRAVTGRVVQRAIGARAEKTAA